MRTLPARQLICRQPAPDRTRVHRYPAAAIPDFDCTPGIIFRSSATRRIVPSSTCPAAASVIVSRSGCLAPHEPLSSAGTASGAFVPVRAGTPWRLLTDSDQRAPSLSACEALTRCISASTDSDACCAGADGPANQADPGTAALWSSPPA